MNKLITILTLLALTLPVSTLAQPEEGPRDRPERDREFQRDRGERGDRPERPGDRARPGERDRQRPEGRDGERGDWRGKREPITVEQLPEALATLREMQGDNKSDWLQKLEVLAEEDPEEAARRASFVPRMRDMMHARKHKPDEFKLHTRQSLLMRELFPKVRELKAAQKEENQAKVDELTPKVREIIGKLFQVRMAFKELEIKQIREKLAAAEKELTDIDADSEALIDEKMNDILTSQPRGPRGEGDRHNRNRPDRDARPENDERSRSRTAPSPTHNRPS